MVVKKYDMTIVKDDEGYCVFPEEQLAEMRGATIDILRKSLRKEKGLKLSVHMEIELGMDNGVTKIISLITKYKVITTEGEIEKSARDAEKEILEKLAGWCGEQSGWRFQDIISHHVSINTYRPLAGSSYLELPEGLKRRKGLINVKNLKDKECFRWCHLAHLSTTAKNPQRISKYKNKIDTVDYEGIEFPVKIDDIPKIEKKNPITCSATTRRSVCILFIFRRRYVMILARCYL